MKKIILTSLLGIAIYSTAFSQNKKPIWLGIQPAMTIEPFYPKGEFDLNVVPLVIQVPLTKRMDIRYTNLANLHFGGNGGFSDIGGEVQFPIFIKKKEQIHTRSQGIYMSPLIGVGRNLVNDHYTMTPAVEGGYMFASSKRFTLTLGLQLGGSYFIYDDSDPEWRNHFGFKANLGFWVND